MADERLKRDTNRITVIGGVTNDANLDIVMIRVDPTSKKLLTEIGSNYAEDAAHSSGATGDFILAVRNDTLAALAGTDGDYAPFQVDAEGALFTAPMAYYDSTKPTAVTDGKDVKMLADSYGRLLSGVEPQRFQATITSADASSATQVKAKTASNKMYILSVIISTDTAMNIQLQDDAGTPNVLMEQIYLAANGGLAIQFPAQAPLVVTTNQDLDVLASAAGNISVTVTGYLAP